MRVLLVCQAHTSAPTSVMTSTDFQEVWDYFHLQKNLNRDPQLSVLGKQQAKQLGYLTH
jgi:hypothetical protein